MARALHGWAVRQSRLPRLYAELGVPDDLAGRFESLTAHVILLLRRIGARTPLGQAVFDVYIGDLDGALREMGVGDLAMAKRMKRLGSAFYGRAKAFDDAFAALPDEAPMRGLLGRTLAPAATAEMLTSLASHLIGLEHWLAAHDPAAERFPATDPA